MSWWTTVDGLVLPHPLSDHPALELVNTRSGWAEPYDAAKHEWLPTYPHLLTLAHSQHVLDDHRTSRVRGVARREPERAAAVVKQAQALRTDLHDVLTGTAGRAAHGRLAEAVTQARARQRLDLGADPPRWTFARPPAVSDPLDALLVCAGDLLVDRPRIGACPGEECGWLFLNRSGRRRWCQMAVCGNRAKQAAHARRTSGPG